MSMAQTRNTFSCKTFAIAIASAVAMGGITIPQAGAVAGYTGYLYAPDEAAIKDWQDAHPNATDEEFKNYLLDEAPITSYQHKITGSTWDVIRYDHTRASYGYATDLNTANGRIDGLIISSHLGGETPVPGSENAPSYGTAHTLKNVQQDFGFENEVEARHLSLDSKRLLYTITRLGQASIDGISPEVKAELAAAGYNINSVKSALADFRNNNRLYQDDRIDASLKRLTEQDIQDGVRKKEDAYPAGLSNIYPASTLTDYLFTALSLAGAAAWSSDSDLNVTGEPATMDSIRFAGEQYAFSVYSDGFLGKDTVKFIDTLIAISSKVTEEDINNSDIPLYWVESADNPMAKFAHSPAIDVVNAKFNANTPEDTTPAEDIHVTDVKKDKKGDYIVTRSDGKSWTIELKDIRDKLAELDKKDTVSPEDLAKVKDDLDKKINDLTDKVGPLEDAVSDNAGAIKDLRDDLNDLKDRVDGLEDRIDALEDAVIKEVRDNGDGTYTLIRENGDEVKGNIDTSGSVTNIKTDGKGNLVITIDGKDKKVPLDQVKITESNKGTPDHTVTITTPDGKSVTFNVFDNYVVDVKREKDGNYKVVRNDGTEWVINLKDIRDKIAVLEAKDSPTRAEFDKVKQDLADLNLKVENEFKSIDNRFTKVEGDITNLRNDLTNLENRITKIESRLTAVEDQSDALTKCVAGAGAAGIPALLSIPLMTMAQMNIPGVKDLNTQIQKQIGIYNAELAQAWERSGGVLQVGATLAGLAGMIGSIAYIANQCDPMMKTPAGQDTDLGQLSSKLEKKAPEKKEQPSKPAEKAAAAQ